MKYCFVRSERLRIVKASYVYLATWLSCALSLSTALGAEPTLLETEPALRRPLALALSHDESHLYVANGRVGSLSIIACQSNELVNEIKIGEKISDFVTTSTAGLYLATDEATHELLIVRVEKQQAQVQQRIPVASYPVRVVASNDCRRAYVTSLWSRRLTVVEFSDSQFSQAKVVASLDLPFAPRCELLVRGDTYLVVADAFGSGLAVINPASFTVVRSGQIPGHGIRGLALTADEKTLLVAHQMLDESAPTVQSDVHWGFMMSSQLRLLRLDSVLDEKLDLLHQAQALQLGEAGNGLADPNDLAVTSQGIVTIALGGVGQLIFGKRNNANKHRVKVGRRPIAIATTRGGSLAYVANHFGDSVSVVDLKKSSVTKEIVLGPKPELSLVDQGEIFFYDAGLSHDGWISCHSCHTDGHTNGLRNDNLSDQGFGAPKRVFSLLGHRGTEPLAWNAAVAQYEDQILSSIRQTMQNGDPLPENALESLTAYVKALEPPPSIDAARGTRDEKSIVRGRDLFTSFECVHCHKPPTFTTPQTYDVGFVDENGLAEFNPPTLLGVGQRGPYFHDNRALDLNAVFHEFKHQLPPTATLPEIADLQAFLRSL